MTVALVHLIPAPADGLASAWSAAFRPATFGDVEPEPGPQQAYGPPLPEGVRGISLTVTTGAAGGMAAGVTSFASYADARRCEPQLRAFWSELAGVPVLAATPAGTWEPALDGHDVARMIWRAPAPEPQGTDPDDEPDEPLD